MAGCRAGGSRRPGSFGVTGVQPPPTGGGGSSERRAGARTWLLVGLLMVSGCRADTGGVDQRRAVPPVPAAVASADSVDGSIVPPDSAIPVGPVGAGIRRGRALLEQTRDSLPDHVGGNLRCMSCHLDDGRRLNASPLLGAYARYPRFVDRSGAVVSIEQRVNYCFTRSLAGTKLTPSSREMRDIVSYLAFLSTGIPAGAQTRGQGTPALPRLSGDRSRGAALYRPNCARCHGSHGEGTNTAPALWGPRSFTIGAGIARESRAAAFIRRNMPNDRPGVLTDQQAFDLAAYVLSQPRPDLPGKANDWPQGDAPYDVPYATRGHAAYQPATLIRRTGDTTGMMVPLPLAPAGMSAR